MSDNLTKRETNEIIRANRDIRRQYILHVESVLRLCTDYQDAENSLTQLRKNTEWFNN